jgi:hypothetical protein
MMRVPMNKAYLKRTIRLLYGFNQTTPKDQKLDPAWDRSTPIWPGMVAMKTKGDNVTLINGTGVPMGLFGLYIGGDGLDEPNDSGVNSVAVWVLGPDAEMEVLAPAFDTTATWTDPGDGTRALVYAQTTGANRGKLVPAGTTGASAVPVCSLIAVDSASAIRVGGLQGHY